jgi:hypothetical protein
MPTYTRWRMLLPLAAMAMGALTGCQSARPTWPAMLSRLVPGGTTPPTVIPESEAVARDTSEPSSPAELQPARMASYTGPLGPVPADGGPMPGTSVTQYPAAGSSKSGSCAPYRSTRGCAFG